MEYVKTFEAFIQKEETTGKIKDKFNNEHEYHLFVNKHEIRFTVSGKEVLAFVKLEHDYTENFWEVEEVDINEKYKRHGFYMNILKECLKVIASRNGKGIVSRKFPIHKTGQRSSVMDMFWEKAYAEEKKDIIITKKESVGNQEGWDYYIQLK